MRAWNEPEKSVTVGLRGHAVRHHAVQCEAKTEGSQCGVVQCVHNHAHTRTALVIHAIPSTPPSAHHVANRTTSLSDEEGHCGALSELDA